ncbi:MAG TPA: BrnT family toxin [Nitrospira sp.]|nr:BrnT family toxin [Nitrospira sp.]
MHINLVRFEWDEATRKANIAKDGIDFWVVPEIFASPMLVGTDTRKDYGETRTIGFGFIRGWLIMIIFT